MIEQSPVRPTKLWYAVAEHVRTQIATGELVPGESLPLEADLLKRYQVSRPTLREALRVLESEGLIELGRGSRKGATILAPSIATASKFGAMYLATQGTTIGEVHQVRTLIEPSMVAFLARNSRDACVVDLRQCAAEQRAAVDAGNYVAAVDALDRLHRLMILHTDNHALCLLAGVLGDMPAVSIRQSLITGSIIARREFRQRIGESVDAHSELVKRIAGGKAATAEKFWRNYMEETAEFLASHGLDELKIHAATVT